MSRSQEIMPGLHNSMECRNECRGGDLCRVQRAGIQHDDGISALAGAARNQQCLKVDGVSDDRAATWRPGLQRSPAERCVLHRPSPRHWFHAIKARRCVSRSSVRIMSRHYSVGRAVLQGFAQVAKGAEVHGSGPIN